MNQAKDIIDERVAVNGQEIDLNHMFEQLEK